MISKVYISKPHILRYMWYTDESKLSHIAKRYLEENGPAYANGHLVLRGTKESCQLIDGWTMKVVTTDWQKGWQLMSKVTPEEAEKWEEESDERACQVMNAGNTFCDVLLAHFELGGSLANFNENWVNN